MACDISFLLLFRLKEDGVGSHCKNDRVEERGGVTEQRQGKCDSIILSRDCKWSNILTIIIAISKAALTAL